MSGQKGKCEQVGQYNSINEDGGAWGSPTKTNSRSQRPNSETPTGNFAIVFCTSNHQNLYYTPLLPFASHHSFSTSQLCSQPPTPERGKRERKRFSFISVVKLRIRHFQRGWYKKVLERERFSFISLVKLNIRPFQRGWHKKSCSFRFGLKLNCIQANLIEPV